MFIPSEKFIFKCHLFRLEVPFAKRNIIKEPFMHVMHSTFEVYYLKQFVSEPNVKSFKTLINFFDITKYLIFPHHIF